MLYIYIYIYIIFSLSLHNFSNKSIGKISLRKGQEKHVGERVGRKKRETQPNVQLEKASSRMIR